MNHCFQDDYAIGILVAMMAWAVIAASILVNPRSREILPAEFQCSFLMVLFEMYTFFAVGCGYLGKAFTASVRTRQLWYQAIKHTTGTGFRRTIVKRSIWACGDVKVRFGSVNYYDRLTALIVLQFQIEKTLSLLLLVKF